MEFGHFSVLLGSGFSIPGGVPGVAAVNKKLSYIKESDFYLSSSQDAGFYYGEYRDPNARMTYLDRFFVERFIAFYCAEYLDGDKDRFNYEIFYDFIIDFLHSKKEKEKVDAFCVEFNKDIYSEPFKMDSYNWVSRTQRIINTLIADFLALPKHFEDVAYSNYWVNGAFFGILGNLLGENIVHVHTLNHDIFFDCVANRLTHLWRHFSDGYTEVGSTVYGQVYTAFKDERGSVQKTYNVRLKVYTGEYENRLRLYKLHGSVDTYVLRTQSGGETRIKKDYGVREFYKEIYDEEAKKYRYDPVYTEKHPDFLTGTTEKIRQYDMPFYENLFNHFKCNLANSSGLLVIGYGFQDKGINDLLETHYLVHQKPVILIDIRHPQCPLFDKYPKQFKFLLRSIDAFDFDELMKEVSP